jgi:cellulose biosynthesis protein BcsQ
VRIGVGHRKGGTSKTTTAVHLGMCLAARFARDDVWLIDADATNDTASMWHALAKGVWPANLHFVRWDPAKGERLGELVRRVVPADAHIVIDTGPHEQGPLADSMRECEVYAVPLRPSRMEVASIRPTLQIGAAVYAEDPSRPFELRALLTQVQANTTVRTEAIGALDALGIPRWETEVHAWVQYNQAFGKVPLDLGEYPVLLNEMMGATS